MVTTDQSLMSSNGYNDYFENSDLNKIPKTLLEIFEPNEGDINNNNNNNTDLYTKDYSISDNKNNSTSILFCNDYAIQQIYSSQSRNPDDFLFNTVKSSDEDPFQWPSNTIANAILKSSNSGNKYKHEINENDKQEEEEEEKEKGIESKHMPSLTNSIKQWTISDRYQLSSLKINDTLSLSKDVGHIDWKSLKFCCTQTKGQQTCPTCSSSFKIAPEIAETINVDSIRSGQCFLQKEKENTTIPILKNNGYTVSKMTRVAESSLMCCNEEGLYFDSCQKGLEKAVDNNENNNNNNCTDKINKKDNIINNGNTVEADKIIIINKQQHLSYEKNCQISRSTSIDSHLKDYKFSLSKIQKENQTCLYGNIEKNSNPDHIQSILQDSTYKEFKFGESSFSLSMPLNYQKGQKDQDHFISSLQSDGLIESSQTYRYGHKHDDVEDKAIKCKQTRFDKNNNCNIIAGPCEAGGVGFSTVYKLGLNKKKTLHSAGATDNKAFRNIAHQTDYSICPNIVQNCQKQNYSCITAGHNSNCQDIKNNFIHGSCCQNSEPGCIGLFVLSPPLHDFKHTKTSRDPMGVCIRTRSWEQNMGKINATFNQNKKNEKKLDCITFEEVYQEDYYVWQTELKNSVENLSSITKEIEQKIARLSTPQFYSGAISQIFSHTLSKDFADSIKNAAAAVFVEQEEEEDLMRNLKNKDLSKFNAECNLKFFFDNDKYYLLNCFIRGFSEQLANTVKSDDDDDDNQNKLERHDYINGDNHCSTTDKNSNIPSALPLMRNMPPSPKNKMVPYSVTSVVFESIMGKDGIGNNKPYPNNDIAKQFVNPNENLHHDNNDDDDKSIEANPIRMVSSCTSLSSASSDGFYFPPRNQFNKYEHSSSSSSSSCGSSAMMQDVKLLEEIKASYDFDNNPSPNFCNYKKTKSSSSLLPLKDFENGVHQLGKAANVQSEKFNVCQEQLCREEELELTKSVFPYQKEEKNDINEHHIKTYTGKNVYHKYNNNNKSSIQIITINKNEHQTSCALDGNIDQYFDTDNSSDNVAFKLASELCQRGPSTTTSIKDFYMSKEESEEEDDDDEEGNSTITRIKSPKILNKISRDSAFLYKNNNGSNKTGFKEELVQSTFDTKVQEKLNAKNFGQIRHSPALSVVEPFTSVLMQSVQSSKTQPQSSKPFKNDRSSSLRLPSEIKINVDHPENCQFIFSKDDGDDDGLNHLLYKDILEINSTTTNTLSKDTTIPLPRSPYILDPDQTVGDHLTKCRLSRRNSKFVTQSDLQTLKEKKQNNTPVQNSKIGGRKDISNSELCPNSNYIDIDEKDMSSKCQLKLCLNTNATAQSNEMGPALCNNNITSNNIKLIPEKPKKSWKCKPDFYGGNESSSSLLTAIVVSSRPQNNNNIINMAAAAKTQNYGNLDMTSRTGYKANMIITKNNYIGTTSHSNSISTKQAIIEGGPNQSNDNKLNNDKDRLFTNEQTLLEINESFFSDGMSKTLPKGQLFQIGHKNDGCNPIKQDGDYLGNGKMCQNEKKKKNLQKEKKNNKNLIINQSYDNSSSDSDNKSSSNINDFESRDLSTDGSFCSNPLHLCENAASDYCKDSAVKIDKSCLIYGFRNELKDTVGPSSEILKTSDLDTEKQAFAQLFANVDDIDNDDQSQLESDYYCYYNNNGNNNSKNGLLPFDSVDDDDLPMHPSQNKDKLKNLQFFRKCSSSSSTPGGNAQSRFRHSSFRTIPKPVVKELNHSTLDLPNLNSSTSKKELINNNNNSNNQQKFSDPLLQFLSESKSLFQSDYEAFLDSTTQQCKNDKARFSKKKKKVKSCAAVGHVPDVDGLFRLNKEGSISSSSTKKNHFQSLRRKSSHSDGRLHEQMQPKNDCHQLSLNSDFHNQQIQLASSFHNHELYDDDDENNNSDNFNYKSNLENSDLLTPPHSSIVSTPCSYLELDSGSEAGFDNNGGDWYCEATNADDEDNYSDEIDETALTQAFLSNLGSFSTRARNSCANEQANYLSTTPANLGNKNADRHKYNISSISCLSSSDSSSTDLYLSNIRSVELCNEDDKIKDLIKGIDDIKHKFEYGETEDNEHKQVSNARDNAIIFRQHSNDACHLPSIQTVNSFVNGRNATADDYEYTKLGTKQDARYIASLKHGYFSNRSFSAVAVQCCAFDCSSNADNTQHSFQERIFSVTESNASPCNSEGFPFIALSVEQSSSSSSLLPLPILESAEFAQTRLDEIQIQTQAHVPETPLNDATSAAASAAVVEADAMFMKNCSADSQAQLSTMVASSSISHNFENNNNFSGQTSSLNTTLISSSQCIAPENLDEQSSTNNKSREDPCYTFRSNFFKYQTTNDDGSASGCCKCQSSHSLQKHAHGLGYHYTHNTTNTLKRTFSNAFNNTFTHDTEDFATQFNFIGNNNLIIFPVKLDQNNIPIKKSDTQDDNNNNNTSQEFSFDDAFHTQPKSTNNRYNDIVTTEEKQDNDEEYLKTADTNYSNISFPTFDFSNEGEEEDRCSSSHFKNFCKDDGYDTDEQEDPSVDFYYRNKKLVLDNIDKRLLKYPNDSDRTVKVPAREVQTQVASTDFIPSLEQCLIYSDNETPTNATEDACSFDSQMIFPMSLEEPEPEPEPSIPVPNNTFSSQHFSELPTVPAESNIKYDQLINELDHVIEKISKLNAKLDLIIGSTSSRDDAQTHSHNLKSKCLANAFVHTYRQIEHEKK